MGGRRRLLGSPPRPARSPASPGTADMSRRVADAVRSGGFGAASICDGPDDARTGSQGQVHVIVTV